MHLPYTIFHKKNLEDISKLLADLTSKEQEGLKKSVYKEITMKSKSLSESERISLVKLMFWSLPDSEKYIYSLLRKMNDPKDFEIHFTIFCFLDQAIERTKDRKLNQRLLAATESYLIAVNKDYAHGAWMAGEFLGAHTKPRISLPILKNVYNVSRHSSGKKAALFGLYRIAQTSKTGTPYKLIKSTSEIEDNRDIQIYAKNLLEKLEEQL